MANSLKENLFSSFKGTRFSLDGESGFVCEQPLLICPLMEAISSTFSGAASPVDPSKLSHDKRKAPSHFDLRPNKKLASEENSKKIPESGKNGNVISLPAEIRPDPPPEGCQKNQKSDSHRKNERNHYPQENQEESERNHYQARLRPTDCNRNRDRDSSRDRVHVRGRDSDRNFQHHRNHDRDFRNRQQFHEQDHCYRDRDRIQAFPERKPRDPPWRQMSEPDSRRPPSSMDRKQWLKELEEDWVRHCTAQWKSDVQKLIHLDVVRAEDSRYSCIICHTGKMSLTTMMGSHVSGKKHQVLAAKSGIYWHPETPTFKNFKNIILGNRNRPPPAKSLSVRVKLAGKYNPPSPQERTIPHVIPKLDRNHVGPLYLKNPPTNGKTEQISEAWVEVEMEMTERMAEQVSEQLLWEEMQEIMSEDYCNPEKSEKTEISEKGKIPENLVLTGKNTENQENSEIPKKEVIPVIPEVIASDPLESFFAAGVYPSMCPSGLPLKSASQMEPCDILSKWNQLQYDLKSTTPLSFGLPFSSGWTQQQPEAGQFYWTGEWSHPQQSWVQQMEQQQQHQPD